MELVRMIALIIFIIVGLVLIVKNYMPILQRILQNKRIHINGNQETVNNKVEKELTILKTSLNSAEKATAFVSLMSLSYVLVHTLINKGNSYCDKVQSEKFQKSLTPEMLKRLNSLEGKYE